MSVTNMNKKILPLSIALVASLSTTACAPVKDAQTSLKATFASDDPCSNNARNTGILVGALAGAVVANQLGDSAAGNMVGATVGAGIGGLIGQDMDARRCELHKIAQKYKIQIKSEAISLADAGMSNTTNKAYKESGSLGLKVNLQDNGKQFLSGSSKLTPQAQAYFTEIAKNYSPTSVDAKDKEQRAAVAKRQILIIGHSDDVGDSNSNAVLAEKRAKVVAKIFAKQGVSNANVHYQGAGETQPIADNRTELGRSQNRRAEIIDLPDKTALTTFLSNRKPVVAFYRTKATPVITDKKPPSVTTEKTNAKNTPQKASTVIKKSNGKWQFEGQLATNTNTVVSIGKLAPKEKAFSFGSLVGVSTAHAADNSIFNSSCKDDNPRSSRSVISLKTGKSLSTAEYLPGMNKTVWIGDAGKHKIGITNVAVARDGGIPTENPNVNFYSTNKLNKTSKAAVKSVAQVNAYQGEDGVLYRMFFTDKKSPVECMDILMPNGAPFKAQSGYIIYPESDSRYVATFTPSKL